jgi:hypothetical protein
MLSGFFTGGGGEIFVLVWVVLIATPIWALMPLVQAASNRSKEQDEGSH